MYLAVWKGAPCGIKVLLTSGFLMSLGFYALIPYLALTMSEHYGWSMAMTGALLGVRQLCQQGLMFLGGAIADRFGVKKILVVGLLVRSIGFLLFGVSSEVWHFFAAAILSGLGGTLFEPSEKAAFELLTPREGRAELIAFRNVTSNIAFAGSALLGSFLSLVSLPVISAFAGLMYVVVAIVVVRRLPPITSGCSAPSFDGMAKAFRNRPFVLYTVLLIGYFYLWGQLYLLLPKAVFDATHSRSQVTLIYALIAIIVVLWQLRVSRRLENVTGRFQLLGAGTFLFGISLFLMGQSHGLLGVAVAGVIFALGTMITTPLVFEMVTYFAPRQSLGTYYGINACAQGIGGAFAASVGGWTYDTGMAMGMPQLPWIVCLVVSLGVFASLTMFERGWARAAVVKLKLSV